MSNLIKKMAETSFKVLDSRFWSKTYKVYPFFVNILISSVDHYLHKKGEVYTDYSIEVLPRMKFPYGSHHVDENARRIAVEASISSVRNLI